MNRLPILVTGSIRSGTTWVGKVLGTAPGVAVIHEPFNIDHQLGMFAHRWSHQYTYLTDGAPESETVEQALRDTLAHSYRPLLHLRNVESMPRSLGLLRDLPRGAVVVEHQAVAQLLRTPGHQPDEGARGKGPCQAPPPLLGRNSDRKTG